MEVEVLLLLHAHPRLVNWFCKLSAREAASLFRATVKASSRAVTLHQPNKASEANTTASLRLPFILEL